MNTAEFLRLFPAAGAIMIALASFSTAARSAEIAPPEKERDGFKLPPGFEIQLVVADPDIGQPMNLNFDVRGRLWVTHSVEYPYPVRGEGVQDRPDRFGKPGDHPPRDRLTVVSGIGPDGKAEKITHFAQGLNIPIGNTPLGDGSAAVAYSIPAIYRFVDADADGQSDERKELYGRFGNVDTHGMSNSYTRWIDGWIYGCHGFSNHSEIKDAAGRVTILDSGNTYRFKEDGSQFQQFTWGQVNPFGLTFDPLGNLYSADCHSMPLYLLLRGALYPHFGNQPDGLGFGPTMMRHNHNSTGICGPAYYAADHFPPEFRDNLFVCNPVTGRINRDKLKAFGSTYQCIEQPDFVSCEGNLFRPVDCIVGPDGALYVADFCNPVIGHYEAPLDHPDRDRTHGRVWRVIYRGESGEGPPPTMMADLTKLPAKEIAAFLAHPNLQVRTLATNYLLDAHAKEAPKLARQVLAESYSAHARAHALWLLERAGVLDDETLDKYAEDDEPLVRVHATRILAERDQWSALNARSARLNLFDGDAFVRRAAADALGRHPRAEFLSPLLVMWEKTPAEDTHLIHMIRLALRAHLRDEAVVAELAQHEFAGDAARRLVEMAAASDSEVPAPIFLAHAQPGAVAPEVFQRAATQIARRGSPEQLEQLLERSPQWFADDQQQQFQILAAVAEGLQQKGVPTSEQTSVKAVLARIAPPLMKSLVAAAPNWTNQPAADLPESASPWGVRHRGSTDGNAEALFWDSISHGERLTGVLRSDPFALPKQLSFWMCGHNGAPNTNNPPVNHIRLVLVKSGEVLAKEIPPRQDIARKYTWMLDQHVGEQVVVEIVDAHRDAAYAWIGVGRFDPPVVRVPSSAADGFAPRLVELIGRCGMMEMAGEVKSLAVDRRQPESLRTTALVSLEQLVDREQSFVTLAAMLNDVDESDEIRGRAAAMLGAREDASAQAALGQTLAASPATLQRAVALALIQTAAGRAALLEAIAAGKASPRLLQAPQIAEQLDAQAGEADKRRIAALTGNLPPVGEQVARQIDHHRQAFNAGEASIDRGRELFKKQCSACHRIGEEGGMVGPQLDGVGNRGLDRLLEDLLDPNRNVDVAFRTTTIETVNGKLITGLERRREGEILVIADQEGKELRIPLGEIAGSRKTNLSLMPSNIADTLKADELRDVLAWLLQQRQKP